KRTRGSFGAASLMLASLSDVPSYRIVHVSPQQRRRRTVVVTGGRAAMPEYPVRLQRNSLPDCSIPDMERETGMISSKRRVFRASARLAGKPFCVLADALAIGFQGRSGHLFARGRH